MKYAANTLLALCSLIIGIHIWGAFGSRYFNWGFSLYSFFDSPFLWSAVIAVGLLSLKSTQSGLAGALSSLLRKLERLPIPLIVIALAIALCTAGAYFAAKLHLLGDGALLLRSLSSTVWGDNITASFNNQPLLYRIFRMALDRHLIDSPLNTYDLYIGINRFGALVFVGMAFWALSKARISPVEKFFIGCILFFNAGSQFFFGYIENYVLQYVTTGLFVVSGWFALERRVHFVLPILFFCVNVGFHLGNIAFLPALIVFLLLYFRKNLMRTIIILAGIGIAGFASLYFVGYLPSLLRHFTADHPDFLHLFETGNGIFPYPMFSWMHLIDWFNLNMLVAPVGLAVACTLLAVIPKERFRESPALVFLIASAACGLFFTWVINSALGMVRDWDLLAGFFLPLIILDTYLLITVSFERKQYVLGVMACVCIFHWLPWIGVNSDEDRHLRRAEAFDVPQLLSPTTQLFYDEALANFFFDHQRYAEAKKYYEHYISLEPRNSRIIGNISDVYRKLGEKEKYFASLIQAVTLQTQDPGIYSNLGVEYASRGDTNKAIEYNLKALEFDPKQDKAHANLGILYTSKHEYRLAQKYFEGAIQLGMRDPMLFKYAADLDYFLEDYPKAVAYYDAYLSARPGDQKTHAMRERANQALQGTPPLKKP
ncbi:MAG TPA: hypothetical protein VL633_03880 [Bacteroidota bacterium]|nr:hypothetical protein [Bacteroidota bacterium]